MVQIDTETVYSVKLTDEDLTRLDNDGELTFDLPSGDVVKLATDYSGSRSTVNTETDETVAADEDVSTDDIEELVKEGEENAPEVSHLDENDDSLNKSGNAGGSGMIKIDRGG